jgi:hypothetical protein
MSTKVNFRILPKEGAGAASGDAAEPLALLSSLRKQDPDIQNVTPANELLKAKNNELSRINNDAAVKLNDEERTRLEANRDAKLARLCEKSKARGAETSCLLRTLKKFHMQRIQMKKQSDWQPKTLTWTRPPPKLTTRTSRRARKRPRG